MTRLAALLLVILITSSSAQTEFSAAQYCTNVKAVISAHELKIMKTPIAEREKLLRSLAQPVDDTPNQPSTLSALCYARQQVRRQMGDPLRADAKIVSACMSLYFTILTPVDEPSRAAFLDFCGADEPQK